MIHSHKHSYLIDYEIDLGHSITGKQPCLFYCYNSNNYATDGDSSRFNGNMLVGGLESRMNCERNTNK